MPFFGRVALSALFSIKNCTCVQILVTSSKNADMLLIPPTRNWTISLRRVRLIVLVSFHKHMHTQPCGTEYSFHSDCTPYGIGFFSERDAHPALWH